jgi:hypothetical protein
MLFANSVLPFYLWNDNSCGIDALYVMLIILTIRYNILQEQQQQQQENKQQYDTLSHLDASLPVVEQAHLAHGRLQNVDELVTLLVGGWLLSVCRNVDVVLC